MSSEEPRGQLSLRTLAMPRDANPNGDIFGGWVISQMDIAAGMAMGERVKVTKGKFTFVAIDDERKPRPVPEE